MRAVPFTPGKEAVQTLMAVVLFSGAILWPNHSAAEGALAVGVPSDVAKQGFAYGYTNNKGSADEARAAALETCRRPSNTKSAEARALCTLIGTYHNQCVAVAMDPEAGTPGVGWAIAANKRAAEAQALTKCEATAGAGRRAACRVDNSYCDGSAN
jgi:hypothetical protein